VCQVIPWPSLNRARVRHAWNWRSDITQQVVNTDIDGLLTAALLHHLKGWPVVGFYDTESLWVARGTPVPLAHERTVWVDADMTFPGARCLSQHVSTTDPRDASAVSAFAETVNPNLAVGCHGGDFAVYRDKYPYGTYQWAAWVAGEPAAPSPSETVLSGLAWVPDGGFGSVMHPAWSRNCLAWATRTLPGSLLEPLARSRPEDASAAVAAASRWLQGPCPDPAAWRNDQYVMSVNRGVMTVVCDVVTAGGRADVQGVLDRITASYGWRRLVLPSFDRRFVGTWRSGRGDPPPDWPNAANNGKIVSFAVTGKNRYCWTEAHNHAGEPSLAEALFG
jgi:hypothetical protein